jgi:hypothetical protein
MQQAKVRPGIVTSGKSVSRKDGTINDKVEERSMTEKMELVKQVADYCHRLRSALGMELRRVNLLSGPCVDLPRRLDKAIDGKIYPEYVEVTEKYHDVSALKSLAFYERSAEPKFFFEESNNLLSVQLITPDCVEDFFSAYIQGELNELMVAYERL